MWNIEVNKKSILKGKEEKKKERKPYTERRDERRDEIPWDAPQEQQPVVEQKPPTKVEFTMKVGKNLNELFKKKK